MNKKEAILKVYNCIKKETAKKAMSIELKKQKTQLIDSKVGGTPYLPVGAEIPVDDDGRQLTLLAQINCEELVGMEDYPHLQYKDCIFLIYPLLLHYHQYCHGKLL